MSRLVRIMVLFAAVATVVAVSGPSAVATPGSHPNRRVCTDRPASDHASCHAHVTTKDDGVTPLVGSGPAGYAPTDLQGAYNLASASALAGGGQTVAIVDAYHDPNAEADLATYRSTFALSTCDSASGCFRQVNQAGATAPYPAVDAGWAQEISLDLDMVSAICPNCRILLVEASSNSYKDLGAAVNTAAALGATVISNSYGGGESFTGSYEGYYNHPGVAITVSSGDSGYGVQFPASARYVTAVGGTTLKQDATKARGWSETAWSGAGSGCSQLYPKPAWQHDGQCARRTVADVSAVADPNTGVSVYDSLPDSTGAKGWMQFGGTSVAAPVIAAVYALAGNATSVEYGSYPYSHTAALYDVSSGANGNCRKASYLCTSKIGYDGPTGWGTPHGATGF